MEHGKISNNIEQANTTDEDTYRRNVERNNKKRKLFAKIGVGILGVGMVFTPVGIAISKYVENRNHAKENTTVTEQSETTENKSNIVLEEQITTVDGVEKDFVDRYLKAYNEKYNTNYTSAEMIVTSLNEGVVYETPNGNHVTRGEYATETEKVLKEIEGGYRKVEGYDKVYQIILSDNTVLGTYNVTTGEFLYSGKQLADLKNKDFIKPELKKLGINPEKGQKAAEVLIALEAEDEKSIQQRIGTYQKTSDIPAEEKTTEDNIR